MCHGQRYAECAEVNDELMTFLLSPLKHQLLNEKTKQKDTVSNHTVATGVAVPSAVAVADLLSSPSILPFCLKFVLIVGAVAVIEDGVSAVIALDSAIVASIGRYLYSQFLHSYVIFISSRSMHAFSVFQ